MLCKVTHCAGCVLANTRPHQLRCGNWEMRTAISSTECSLVDACVGLQNCCHQLNSSVHSHSNVRTAHMGQPCLDPQATVQSKSQHRTSPETNRQHLLTHNNYKMAQLHWDKEKFLAPSNVPLAGWPWHLRQEEGVKWAGRSSKQEAYTHAQTTLICPPNEPAQRGLHSCFWQL